MNHMQSQQTDTRSPRPEPKRLRMLIPPLNFGAVTEGQVFRSAFPQPHNVSFLQDMGLKTIVCLVDTEVSKECESFIHDKSIRRIRIDIAANKEGQVRSSLESIYEAVLAVMDVANYPLLIHCNQGRHRTGCVIACMRRMQGWSTQAALDEYETYANPKMRDGDKKLISEVFEPESMLEHLKHIGIDHRPSLMRLLKSDLVSIQMLNKILASMDGVSWSHLSLKSNTSSKADSGVDIAMGGTDDPQTIVESAEDISMYLDIETRDFAAIAVSIQECGPLSPPLEEV